MASLTDKVANVHIQGSHPKLTLVGTMYRERQASDGWMKDISINEDIIHGLSTGVGGLYLRPKHLNESPLFLGTNSLDPLQSLSMVTGTWVNKRFSSTPEAAVREMEEYLSIWKKPVLAAVNALVLPEIKADPFEQHRMKKSIPVGFCLVSNITDDEVTLFVCHQERPVKVPVTTFKEALEGLTNQWVDIIFPKQELHLPWAFWQALKRNTHTYQHGWRNIPSGLQGLQLFLADIKNQDVNLIWSDAKGYVQYLGEDFGRYWYSNFLYMMSHLFDEPGLASAANRYRELSEAWTIFLHDWKSSLPSEELITCLYRLEEEALQGCLEIVNLKRRVYQNEVLIN